MIPAEEFAASFLTLRRPEVVPVQPLRCRQSIDPLDGAPSVVKNSVRPGEMSGRTRRPRSLSCARPFQTSGQGHRSIQIPQVVGARKAGCRRRRVWILHVPMLNRIMPARPGNKTRRTVLQTGAACAQLGECAYLKYTDRQG